MAFKTTPRLWLKFEPTGEQVKEFAGNLSRIFFFLLRSRQKGKLPSWTLGPLGICFVSSTRTCSGRGTSTAFIYFNVSTNMSPKHSQHSDLLNRSILSPVAVDSVFLFIPSKRLHQAFWGCLKRSWDLPFMWKHLLETFEDLCLWSHSLHSPRAVLRPLTTGGHGQLSAVVKLDPAASWVSELGSLGTAQVPPLAASSHNFSTHEFCHVMQVWVCSPSCPACDSRQPLGGKGKAVKGAPAATWQPERAHRLYTQRGTVSIQFVAKAFRKAFCRRQVCTQSKTHLGFISAPRFHFKQLIYPLWTLVFLSVKQKYKTHDF